MANELQAQNTSGATVYAVILSAVGQAWNGTSFENPLAANWATYKVAATEQSTTGLYEATMPAGISTAGLYSVLFYIQIGGAPAATDTVIGKGTIEWSGTAEIPRSAIPANVWTNATRTLTAFGFSVTVSGNVTVGGYAAGQDPATLLASSFNAIPANVWANGSRTLTAFGFSVTVSGNVTVGGYATGQDPATLLASNFTAIAGNVWANSTRTLSSAGLDSVLVEGQAIRKAVGLILASAGGEMSGPSPGTPGEVVAMNASGTPRITATVDANGYRTSVTYSPEA